MSTVLQTTTSLNVSLGNFVLLTEYSGEVNPNVTFTILFTVTDGLNVIIGAEIEVGVNTYITDNNGQVSLTLTRGDYIATISAVGYSQETVNFTILDQNLTEDVSLMSIGSFSMSYDDSYENIDAPTEYSPVLYGRLYNWIAVDDTNFAPVGYHLPTDEEWTELIDYLNTNQGGKLKESGITHWGLPNTGSTNEFGFNALPSGYRVDNGLFNGLLTNCYFWSKSEQGVNNAYYRMLFHNSGAISRFDTDKNCGMSVRFIKDDDVWTDGDYMIDIEGNTYKTVKIGNQVWTSTNFKCTQLNDTTPIDIVTDGVVWAGLSTPAICSYNNDSGNI